MHSYALTGQDSILSLPLLDRLAGRLASGATLFPAAPVALGYGAMTLIFLAARYFTVPRADDEIA
jgi:hypothetical protein